jgi:hypothetical protein
LAASTAWGGACVTDSLADYISNFGNNTSPTAPMNGCTQSVVGNPSAPVFINYGFTFATSSMTGNSDTAGDIGLTPTSATPMFTLGGFESLSAGAGDLEYFIGYNIDPAPVINGDSISLDPFTSGTATLNVYVCTGADPYFLGDDAGEFECGSSYGTGFTNGVPINLADPAAVATTGSPMAMVTFGSSTSQVGILLELILNAGSTGTGTGEITNTLSASAVPEPASALMIGSGLAAAIFLRKRIRARLRAR